MDILEGIVAVKAARAFIESEVRGEVAYADLPSSFDAESGVFVTLSTYPDGMLRGCIGYPEPYYPLREALEASARHACHDPRFNDLSERELDNVTVEVTALTVPKEIAVERQSLPGSIAIGRHGLMIECLGRRGLLLPQVPVEWGWDAETFLRELCHKAGLPGDYWKRDDANISVFEGEIFREVSPHGEVVRA